MLKIPTIAIVGRPNVGKSSLLNRIVGHSHAIVDPSSGVTRDRNYAEGLWNGRKFYVVDTGGLDPEDDRKIMRSIKDQVSFALDEANAVIFLCDSKSGIIPDDRVIFEMLRKKLDMKPVFVVVNKVDNPSDTESYLEFYELGIENVYPISAVHGHGVADLLDEIVTPFDRAADQEADENSSDTRIAIVGKPNVGKSSLFNRLIGKSRAIVDNIPGTTRDTIIFRHERNGKVYNFIDTAGLRRPNSEKETVEQFSVFRTLGAISRSDLAILVFDAEEGAISQQDKRIASRIIDSGSGCVMVWNKWDVADKRQEMWKSVLEDTRKEFPLLEFAPVVACSAKTGQRVMKLFELIDKVKESGNEKIPQERLNSILFEAVTIQPPPSYRGRAIKLSSLRQMDGPPVVFKVTCSEPNGLHFSYQRFLLNLVRREKPFEGWPVRLNVVAR